MTVVEDRPETEVGRPPRQTRPARATSPTSTWRFAARLARRDVRRRPGRSVLVVGLIAVPVLALTLASIGARTLDDGNAPLYERSYGASDLTFSLSPQLAFDESADPVVLDGVYFAEPVTFPAGTTATTIFRVGSPVRALNAAGVVQVPWVEIRDLDPADPTFDAMFVVDSGVAPTGPDEVLLTTQLADRFDVGLGDTLHLSRPEMDLEVTGFGRQTEWASDGFMLIPGFDRDLVLADYGSTQALIDLPAGTDAQGIDALVAELRSGGLNAQTPTNREFQATSNVRVATLAWGWVAGVVGFIAVGIVIAAAFAMSARRQLISIGQLSANGAPDRLVRRTLALQGTITAAIGAAIGIGVGVTAVYALRDEFERVVGRPVGDIRVHGLDLVVIAITAVVAGTCAALVPARTAAKIPVLSALAGRQPLSTPPAWLVPVGIGLFGGGLFLLAAAATTTDPGNLTIAMAVLGALAVLFGMVCSSPVIVSAVGSVGSRAGGIVRLAARSLSRSRSRSAGVMTAIATVSALAISGLTVAGASRAYDDPGDRDLSVVSMGFWQDQYLDAYQEDGSIPRNFDPDPIVPKPLPSDVRVSLERLLPDATWTAIETVIEDPVPDRSFDGATRELVSPPTIATDAVIAIADLDHAQLERLRSTGVLALAPWLGDAAVFAADGELVEIDVGAPISTTRSGPDEAFIYFGGYAYIGDVLVTPEYAAARGFETGVSRIIIDNPTDLNSDQRRDLSQLQTGSYPDSFVPEASAPEFRPTTDFAAGIWQLDVPYAPSRLPWSLIQAAVLAAALLAVLLVVAIGLSLAATESRDERDVLHAIGAAPRTLRRVAAAKAWVLCTGAAVVAVPTGYLVVRVVTGVNGQSAPFPFIGALAMLVVIPAIAAAVTLAVSAVAQRARPISVSTMAAD